MIKPEHIKLVTYHRAKSESENSMWYNLSGNGGNRLNKKSRRLIQVISNHISDSDIGGINSSSKKFALLCKETYRNGW